VRVPRLRVFAGPNGSGKSTIKHILAPELIYTYVNADDLEREARDRGAIDLTPFKVHCAQDAFKAFFVEHPLRSRSPIPRLWNTSSMKYQSGAVRLSRR